MRSVSLCFGVITTRFSRSLDVTVCMCAGVGMKMFLDV